MFRKVCRLREGFLKIWDEPRTGKSTVSIDDDASRYLAPRRAPVCAIEIVTFCIPETRMSILRKVRVLIA